MPWAGAGTVPPRMCSGAVAPRGWAEGTPRVLCSGAVPWVCSPHAPPACAPEGNPRVCSDRGPRGGSGALAARLSSFFLTFHAQGNVENIQLGEDLAV